MSIMKTTLDNLLKELECKGLKGRSSSKSHLKSALYDWQIEGNWNNPNAFIFDYSGKGYAFTTITKREPRHCTLRHIFVLEEYRGQGIGVNLIDMMKTKMVECKVERLRFFADLPSVEFYERLGFTWHGESKGGLPFYYGDMTGSLIELPKSQKRYLHKEFK